MRRLRGGLAWAGAIAIVCVSGARATTGSSIALQTIRGAAVAQPQAIAAARDGSLWFTNARTSTVGRIAPSGAVRVFSFPSVTAPRAIAVGPDGSIWFTSAGQLNRMSPTGTLTRTVPIGSAVPIGGLAVAANGSAWFTEGGEAVGEVLPDGTVRAFTLPGTMRGTQGITAGPDGAMWFTNYLGPSIARIAADGNVKTFTDPRIRYPAGITTGPDGALWFTDDSGAVGRITTAGAISVWGTSATVGHPDAIATGPDRALWVTGRGGYVARVTTSGAITRYATPATAFATGIAATSKSLWVTAFSGNTIVRVTPGSAGQAPARTAPTLPRVTLISDSVASAIWFDPSARATLAQGLDLFLEPGQGRQLGGSVPAGTGPPTALDLIQQLGARLGQTVILFVGDNDNYSDDAWNVESARDDLIAVGVTHIIWVTLHVTPEHTSYTFMNDAIRHQGAADPTRVTVVDWKAYSASHPEWFEGDGVHLAGGGAAALAQLLHAQLVRLGVPG